MSQRVYNLFQRSVEAKMQVGEELAPLIEVASNKIVECLVNDGKLLICGNGTSAALAQVFTASLLDRYEKERPSLPAIWLGSNMSTYTAIASSSGFDDVYSKPISALAKEGDTLIIISTSGNATNLIHAIQEAQSRGVGIVAITGRDGGQVSAMLGPNDVELCAQINSRGRIHEIHLLTVNCLCDLIDHHLFGID